MKDKMTWEETIEYIRTLPEYSDLVRDAYFDSALEKNVEKYRNDQEFRHILQTIKKYQPNAKKIIDIGSGNGITAISFALEGFEVTTLEPDPSNTIGAGAIKFLKQYYKLDNLTIYESFAENTPVENGSFDIAFARQCMHHAYDLDKFVSEMSRVLKKEGLFFTVRDHVIFDEEDKKWFLENHPLQKFYHGENAFTSEEYRSAISKAGLQLVNEYKYYDSIINFFPLREQFVTNFKNDIRKNFKKKYKLISFLPIFEKKYLVKKLAQAELKIPGRMYTYIAKKI